MNQEQQTQARVREALEWVKWADSVVSELSDLKKQGADVYRESGENALHRDIVIKNPNSTSTPIKLHKGTMLSKGRYVVERPYSLVHKHEPSTIHYQKLSSALKRVRDDYKALEDYAKLVEERESLQNLREAFLHSYDRTGLTPRWGELDENTRRFKFGDTVTAELIAERSSDGQMQAGFNIHAVQFGVLNREEAELLGEAVDEFKRTLRKMRGDE